MLKVSEEARYLASWLIAFQETWLYSKAPHEEPEIHLEDLAKEIDEYLNSRQ